MTGATTVGVDDGRTTPHAAETLYKVLLDGQSCHGGALTVRLADGRTLTQSAPVMESAAESTAAGTVGGVA